MIESMLDQLSKKQQIVLIMKANEGYSAIPVSKTEYAKLFLLRDHWNGNTVEEAIFKFMKANKI